MAKFNSVAEAFNHYRGQSVEQIEQRAQELRAIVETDPEVDIQSMKIELEGLQQAKTNAEENASEARSAVMNIITGMSSGARRAFDVETVLDTPEYRSAFLKKCIGQACTDLEERAYSAGMEYAEKRADAFNATTNSLAVLPSQMLNEIVSKVHEMGGLVAEARQFNMPSKVQIPVGTGFEAGAWHTEGATVEAEAVTTTSVTFDANEIIRIVSISAKVKKMSIPAFEQYIVSELASAILETIDKALVDGTGVGQGQGLESITWTDGTNAVEIASGSDISYKDIVELFALLPSGYASGNVKVFMNRSTLYRSIYGLVDGNKRPIFVADLQNGGVGSILGAPVVLDSHIPDGVMYLGDASRYLGVNIPEGIGVEVSRDSSFRKGLVDIRGICVADTRVIVPDAFVKLYKATA